MACMKATRRGKKQQLECLQYGHMRMGNLKTDLKNSEMVNCTGEPQDSVLQEDPMSTVLSFICGQLNVQNLCQS